jgi:hypothetical protein
MAVTRSDVVVPKGVWTDLYAASGITAGVAVFIINKGMFACNIAISAAAPTNNLLGVPLYTGPVGNSADISASQAGLWAYSPQGTSYLNVQE